MTARADSSIPSALAALMLTVAVAPRPRRRRSRRTRTNTRPRRTSRSARRRRRKCAASCRCSTTTASTTTSSASARSLVRAIPQHSRHPEFRYSFDVVNQKEINAFALPGGPMFLHRGMIEAAKNEGEVAGVMAHEIAHVALRHGTAQATKGAEVPDRRHRRADPRRHRRRRGRQRHRAGIAVRAGRLLPEVRPRVRARSRPARRADHGARGLRPAAHGRHVPHDRAAEQRRRRTRVAEQPPESGQPLRRDSAGGGDAAHSKERRRRRRSFRTSTSRLRGMPPAYTAEQIARAKAATAAPAGQRPAAAIDDDIQCASGNVPRRAALGLSIQQRPASATSCGCRCQATGAESAATDSVTFAPEGAHYRGRSGQTRLHARRCKWA